jgi:transcriptional regulator with XRE-family HTH domain
VARRVDVAEFLRARRAAVGPGEVGLPAGGRRRTPGLRREEVALLAGVSVSWYTWLEQGRPINVSLDVLEALARVLRLDEAEHAHLLALAGHPGRPATHHDEDPTPETTVRLLGVLDPCPAYVLSPRWDYLAWNDAHRRLLPDIDGLPAHERNLVWTVFANPYARSIIVDWEAEARRVLSQYRADTVDYADDPAVRGLVARLQEASPEFAAWWPRHDVAGFASRIRRFAHPLAGALTFEHLQLVPAGADHLRVIVHLGIPGDDSIERLAAVGSASER